MFISVCGWVGGRNNNKLVRIDIVVNNSLEKKNTHTHNQQKNKQEFLHHKKRGFKKREKKKEEDFQDVHKVVKKPLKSHNKIRSFFS